MAYVSLSAITQTTIGLLSQAGGVGTQRYSEARIQGLIQLTFEMLFLRQWWPQFMQGFTCTLDGTTGVVVEDISSITRYQDIRAVFQSGSDVQLQQLPAELNPLGLQDARIMFIEPNNTDGKVFRVWSPTATGTLYVHARLEPAVYTPDDIVKFDRLALAYGAAWAYAEDDGTNPGASQKFQILFENRVHDLEAELLDKPISLDNTSVKFPTMWWYA